MPGFVTKGAAALGKVQEIVRVNSPGPLDFVIQNLGDADVLMSFFRHGGNMGDRVLYNGEDTYQTQTVSSGESLTTPVLPKSLKLTVAGAPTLYDRDGDGVLRIMRPLGVPLASSANSFAGGDGSTSSPSTRQFTAASGDFINRGVQVGDILQITSGKDAGKYTITARNSATVLVVDRTFPTGNQTNISWVVYPADLKCGNVDYFTGRLTLTYPGPNVPGARACVKGTCTFPVALNPGMTLIVTGDHSGGGTATWDASAAVLAGSGGTFEPMAGETMQIKVGPDSAPWQTITFGTEATIGQAIDRINSLLIGAVAVLNVNQVDLVSVVKGTSARIKTQNVATGITSKLGIPNRGDAFGTGDVLDISAVTYSEFASRITADMTTILPVLEAGSPKLVSNTAYYGSSSTIRVTGGTAAAIFGFDLDAHTGADPGAEQGVFATYLTGILVPAGKVVRKSIVNLPNEEIIVGAIGKTRSSQVSVEYFPIGPRL